jgi:cardiolipin synthase A/B
MKSLVPAGRGCSFIKVGLHLLATWLFALNLIMVAELMSSASASQAQPGEPCGFRWLSSGDVAFDAMIGAIEAATRSVRLETYTFVDCALGRRFREALVRARARGARVRVLIDAMGSWGLPEPFWEPLTQAGGQFRWFNPLSLARWGLRDHRKLLVCDERFAFVGGFNIAPEYEGDGIIRGWRDFGLQLDGPLVRVLARSFDLMFHGADLKFHRTARLRKPIFRPRTTTACGELLQSGPGLSLNTIRSCLQQDIKSAKRIQIAAAYFLPPWRLRLALQRAARRGGQVQLFLPGISDVRLSQLASRRLYDPLLRAGVEIYEYQPQMLHAKVSVVDDAVYLGSANLDVRSLRINYELVVRMRNPKLATEARLRLDELVGHCHKLDPATWSASRSLWSRLKERWSYFLLVHVDPFLARRQQRRLWQ